MPPATPAKDMRPIMVRVPPEVYARIPVHAGVGGKHARNGVGAWVAGLIYRELKISPPANGKPSPPDLSSLDPTKLEPKMRLIVQLYNSGMTVRQLVEHLKTKNVPTTRGGQWNEHNLIKTLARLAKKHGLD